MLRKLKPSGKRGEAEKVWKVAEGDTQGRARTSERLKIFSAHVVCTSISLLEMPDGEEGLMSPNVAFGG